MRTGWWWKYKVDRPLYPREQDNVLPKKEPLNKKIKPEQMGSIIRLNSTYIDVVDSHFRQRGMFYTTCGSLFMVLFIVMSLMVIGASFKYHAWVLIIPIAMFFSAMIWLYLTYLRKDYFTYTHYPIRFNRKNRKVYVFQHNGPGGVLIASWDEVLFYLGRDTVDVFLCNMRGALMEDNIIRTVFSFGHDLDDGPRIRQVWEFIRRYMEEGPEAVECNSTGRCLQQSVRRTWKNYVIEAGTYCQVKSRAAYYLAAPIYLTFAACRWLVFKTCKDPIFPSEVEAECRIDHNDPNVWKVPRYTGQY